LNFVISALVNHGRTLLPIRFAANYDTFVTQRCMMKLILEKLMPGSEAEFTFKEIRNERFSCPWHYHPENEFPPTSPCAFRKEAQAHVLVDRQPEQGRTVPPSGSRTAGPLPGARGVWS